MFAVQLDARPSKKPSRSRTSGGPAGESESPGRLGFRWQARGRPRGRCNTQMKRGPGKEGGSTRIDRIKDEERTEEEEVTSKEDDRGESGGGSYYAFASTQRSMVSVLIENFGRDLEIQDRGARLGHQVADHCVDLGLSSPRVSLLRCRSMPTCG